MATEHGKTIRALLEVCGRTYADEAGIEPADKPAPLYRLSVLALLLSTRIKADIAVAAAVELTAAGMTSPKKMAEASWQDRVDALGRAHYRRYDEQTATALGAGAELLADEYAGDLRRMRERAGGSTEKLRRELTRIPRVGPTGADIFFREVQGVWPELHPYLDKKALDGAAAVGLPKQGDKLAELVEERELPVAAAALVRVSLRPTLAREVVEAAR